MEYRARARVNYFARSFFSPRPLKKIAEFLPYTFECFFISLYLEVKGEAEEGGGKRGCGGGEEEGTRGGGGGGGEGGRRMEKGMSVREREREIR